MTGALHPPISHLLFSIGILPPPEFLRLNINYKNNTTGSAIRKMHKLWSMTLRKISKIGATRRQMFIVKAKMQQIWFPLMPRTSLGGLPSDLLAVFKGPTSKGRGREGEWWDRGGGKGGGRTSGREVELAHYAVNRPVNASALLTFPDTFNTTLTTAYHLMIVFDWMHQLCRCYYFRLQKMNFSVCKLCTWLELRN